MAATRRTVYVQSAKVTSIINNQNDKLTSCKELAEKVNFVF